MGAFSTGTPLENVSSLQIFALCIGPTLLAFAAAIAERNRGERAIHESYQRFRLLIGATKDTIYERDLETNTLRLSQAELLRADKPTCVNSFEDFVARIHPDDRHRVIEVQANTLRDGLQQWEADFRFRRGDGTWLHVHEDAYVVRDAYGRPTEVVGRLADVTERHDTEELS